MKDSLVGYQSLIVFAKCELVGVSFSMQTRHYLLGFHTTCPSGGTDSFGVGLRLSEVVVVFEFVNEAMPPRNLCVPH